MSRGKSFTSFSSSPVTVFLLIVLVTAVVAQDKWSWSKDNDDGGGRDRDRDSQKADRRQSANIRVDDGFRREAESTTAKPRPQSDDPYNEFG